MSYLIVKHGIINLRYISVGKTKNFKNILEGLPELKSLVVGYYSTAGK